MYETHLVRTQESCAVAAARRVCLKSAPRLLFLAHARLALSSVWLGKTRDQLFVFAAQFKCHFTVVVVVAVVEVVAVVALDT